MERPFDARMKRVLDHIRRRATPASAPPDHDQERRQARARVLAALPRLLSLLAAGVIEMNDMVAEDGLWLTLTVAERLPAFEALFIVDVEDPLESGGPSLAVTVDYQGRVAFLLQRDDKRSLLRAANVFTADHTVIQEALVDFLEARYPHA